VSIGLATCWLHHCYSSSVPARHVHVRSSSRLCKEYSGALCQHQRMDQPVDRSCWRGPASSVERSHSHALLPTTPAPLQSSLNMRLPVSTCHNVGEHSLSSCIKQHAPGYACRAQFIFHDCGGTCLMLVGPTPTHSRTDVLILCNLTMWIYLTHRAATCPSRLHDATPVAGPVATLA
jgi:hypothetical protein